MQNVPSSAGDPGSRAEPRAPVADGSLLILSNYGLRFLQHRGRTHAAPDMQAGRVLSELRLLRRERMRPFEDDPRQRVLVTRGLAQTVPADTTMEKVELRYRRNPLENVQRVIFEFTTACRLNCLHCRNGHLPPVTETRVDVLQAAVDLCVDMGVRSFHFIGGEVMQFGRGWLDVVEHAQRHEGTDTGVLTSGWFLEEEDFVAAGERYADDRAFLEALRAHGLTHVIFSVDGPEPLHDLWRGVPGLYRRVTRGFDKVREAGMVPRVSLVLSDESKADPVACTEWLVEMADLAQPEHRDLPADQKVERLLNDPASYASSLVDVGNAVGLTPRKFRSDEIPDAVLRCKNFFRPWPNLRIQANGDVSLCPLLDAGQGFGNIHGTGLLSTLNHLQDTFVFRLHAEQRMGEYRQYVDPEIFGEGMAHVCSLRTVITMLAKAMHERGVDPDDAAALRELNVEIARRAGWLPPAGALFAGT